MCCASCCRGSTLTGLLNTTIEQIRAYATTDAAVSLRLLRLLHDVAVTATDPIRVTLIERGERVVEGCRGQLPPDDVARLEQRLADLTRLRGERASPERHDLAGA
jgi:uncharacterized membrane protein